jgi:hypothetical protein
LGNREVRFKDFARMIAEEAGTKPMRMFLPLGMANLMGKMMERQAKRKGTKPLMTSFSVYNLARNNEFDCTKARTELGYTTRSYEETIHDEVQWMIAEGLIDGTGVTEKQTVMANEQIREGGFDVKEVYQNVEDTVVDTYQKIEDGVVGGYRKIEDGAVNGFQKVMDFFIRIFFARKNETVEEAKERLRRK